MRFAVLSLFVMAICCNHINAQERPTAEVLDLRRQAAAFYQRGDFKPAMEAYEALTRLNPYDGALWLGLAHSAQRLDNNRAAIRAFNKALEVGAGNNSGRGFRPEIFLEIARASAQIGDDETVYASIESALANRLREPGVLLRDDAFREFREQDRFKRLVGLPTTSDLSRDEGWRFDIELLEREANRMHVNPDGPRVPLGFSERLRDLRAEVPTLSDSAIFLELMQAIVLLGDGHCSVSPGPSSRIPLSRLPIDLYVFGDGMFIVDGQEEFSRWVGSKVIEFEGKPSQQALEEIATFLPRDNPMGLKSFGPFALTLPLALEHLGIAAEPDEVRLNLIDPDGTTQEVSFRGGPFRMTTSLPILKRAAESPPLSMQQPEANYWYQPIPDLRAVYLQFNQVVENPDKPIPSFLAELRQSLRGSSATSLIVDVRRNGGGNAFYNREFVRTFVHFEMMSPEHRIYVLMGRHTFSAAQNLVTQIERMTDAIFVGEPSGSRPNHIGEDSMRQLPHSGLIVSISSRYFQDSDPTDDRIWIAPDVAVEILSTDYFAGQDKALSEVYEMIRRGNQSR